MTQIDTFEELCDTPRTPATFVPDDLTSFLESFVAEQQKLAHEKRAAEPATEAVPRRAPALREALSIGTTSPAPLARAQILIWADMIMN